METIAATVAVLATIFGAAIGFAALYEEECARIIWLLRRPARAAGYLLAGLFIGHAAGQQHLLDQTWYVATICGLIAFFSFVIILAITHAIAARQSGQRNKRSRDQHSDGQ